ncbi:hypothetical protein GCK72_022696 [Caenorhabditis remanei]|uniref:Uncharacterized protein n=1 Tax=Caenorhabditis remanei TaxID=31234 RepID=A0A6A5FUM9_CAERE|nr:hypothetical protein GCK72_022696 [Caenorhabditis remanei]KAF1746243.1 hypothetical protein GCK72_022696 [Caenorhabditis remanei]
MRILNVQNRTWRKKDEKSLEFTLSLEQLDEFLEKFDCDKSLLTTIHCECRQFRSLTQHHNAKTFDERFPRGEWDKN